jgi:hypothetical protein
MILTNAPKLEKMMERHSILIFIQRIANEEDAIPVDCIIREKSLDTLGLMCNKRVITGKAIAPPPSEVAP